MDSQDIMKFAEWLANVNCGGANDETFAEFFVYTYKTWKSGGSTEPVTKDDMKNFSVNEFTEWLGACLHEIIDKDSDCCESAWWKQEG